MSKSATRSSKRATSKEADRLTAERRKQLAALDDEFFGEVVGVAQAVDALRGALKRVSAALDARQFEKASALGYAQVASEFIFLQRTLGGLQGACLHKEQIVQELAAELRWSYEDVLPKVDAVMESASPIDRKQRIANRKKAAPQIRAAIDALKKRFSKEPEGETARVRRRKRARK